MGTVLEHPATELAEKKSIYFEEGAQEVWFCLRDGQMLFFSGPEDQGAERSTLLPEFPPQIV